MVIARLSVAFSAARGSSPRNRKYLPDNRRTLSTRARDSAGSSLNMPTSARQPRRTRRYEVRVSKVGFGIAEENWRGPRSSIDCSR
jgi:hypothetical protein